jgi:hypothetical protein
MAQLVEDWALDAGTEVVVETTFGTYRGLLVQPYAGGSHVKLRYLGHDLLLNMRSVYGVHPAERF